jgi:hypothetical protein
VVKNVGIIVGIACRHLFTTSFRLTVISTSGYVADILSSGWRPMSGHVGCVMSDLGLVQNVEVAIEISFVVVMQAEITCIYAHFKAFPVFRPPYWISGW